MRHASAPVLAVVLACAAFGCATPHAQSLAGDTPRTASAPARGAELYGRYCTGCHESRLSARNARGGEPALMHIQARLGMGTVPSFLSEALTQEDARQIVDYLDAGGASRLAD